MHDTLLAVEVTRLRAGRYSLAWQASFADGPVCIRAADRPHDVESAPIVAEQARSGIEIELDPAVGRHYFHLASPDGESLVVADRAVALNGAVNFRDLGGYRTADGRRIKWGQLFRSGHLSKLDAADMGQVAELGISTLCDFRLAEERASEYAELPGDPSVHVLGIPPGVGDKESFHRLFASADGPAEIVAAIHTMMEFLVRGAAPHYQGLFDALLARPRGAVLMNCSAGKERTGVASALLLHALGVPRETIMYDFMLSGRYFPATAEVPRVLKKYRVDDDVERGTALIMPLLEARTSYLEAAFAAIEEDFGTVEAFLSEQFALDASACDQLRDQYTR